MSTTLPPTPESAPGLKDVSHERPRKSAEELVEAARRLDSASSRAATTSQPGSEQSSPAQSSPAEEEKPQYVGNWAAIIWLALLHVGAIFAVFTFTWQAVAVLVFMHWLTGGLGICLGYHRLFTHSSFTTYRPVRWVLAMLGTLSGEGAPLQWVADHRKHHAFSDHEGDPHSPRDGAWWAHMLWLGRTLAPAQNREYQRKWAPDLEKDPVIRVIGQWQLLWHALTGAALLGAGYAFGGWTLGVSLLVWGLFLRLTLVLHSTWLVNSASHMWGYVNYKTKDDSRNNWFVALISYGEGWHNNHHAYPRMANHGHRWWEFDVTFRMIRLMQRLGLAWDVVDYKSQSDKADKTSD